MNNDLKNKYYKKLVKAKKDLKKKNLTIEQEESIKARIALFENLYKEEERHLKRK